MENIINGLKQIKNRVDSGAITTVNGTETLLSKHLEYLLKEAINYTRCCTELPTKEAELSELEKLVEQQSNSDIKLFKKDGYLGGFCDGFRLYSNWLRNK